MTPRTIIQSVVTMFPLFAHTVSPAALAIILVAAYLKPRSRGLDTMPARKKESGVAGRYVSAT